ncbi:MAG TPA: class I SAM-dependent methyltransferase [Solirubrobacteraceae bacterium]|nr:class I SAM-dependent methyltransferase [Solirubrobacteraceae bacterium]
MAVPPDLFDEDYLYFCHQLFGAERSDGEAALVSRLLDLAPGMRVLDVPCGEGRIAGRLAAAGCEVVGVDNSELFLALGRERWPAVTFVAGDMRELRYDGDFDAVVNWYTGFGYFDRATNDAVLAAFARALRPGGQLLIELHNPGRLARAVEIGGGQAAQVTERDRNLMVDRVRYDRDEGFSHTERFMVRDGSVRKVQFSLEQIPAPALVQRLQVAGFAEVSLLGHDGGPFDPEGPRLIAVARRAG